MIETKEKMKHNNEQIDTQTTNLPQAVKERKNKKIKVIILLIMLMALVLVIVSYACKIVDKNNVEVIDVMLQNSEQGDLLVVEIEDKETEQVVNEPEENTANKQEQQAENKTNTTVNATVPSSNGSPYYIKVNYTANVVTIYKLDGNGKYTVPIKAMICSTGKETPRSGVYKTPAKYRWALLNGNVWGQYSTRVVRGILFHSVPYAKQAANTLYPSYYDKLGLAVSAGCIRLTVADAKWIYDNCPIGTMVEFYSSSDPGPLGKPTAMKISGYASNLRCWDPTDPDPNNPWIQYFKEQEAQQNQNTEITKPEEVVKPENDSNNGDTSEDINKDDSSNESKEPEIPKEENTEDEKKEESSDIDD